MPGRFKILLLSHFFYPNTGGIETVSRLLAEQFSKAGHEIVVVTWTKNGEADDFPFKVVRHPSIIHLIRLFLWADMILENNPCLRLSWPGFFIRKPNMIVLQTWLDHGNNKNKSGQRLKMKKLALADKVVAISNAIKEKSWPAATVIHNPYDGRVFNLINSGVRKNSFVFLGRLVPDKGADCAIKAIHSFLKDESNELIAQHKPLLTIIGDGTERGKLQNLVAELEMHEHVHFTGALQAGDVAAELNKHAYLLVPSVWEEPFGIVVLEGMACGCIPVIARSGGLPEATGDAGISFENKNLKALVSTLHFITKNTELQLKYRRNSAAHLDHHTAEKIAKEYLTLIMEIIEK